MLHYHTTFTPHYLYLTYLQVTTCMLFFHLCSKPGCHWHHLLGVLRPVHCHPLSSAWMDLWQLYVQICCLSTAGKTMTLFTNLITIIYQKCAFLYTELAVLSALKVQKKRHLSSMSDLLLNWTKHNNYYDSMNLLKAVTLKLQYNQMTFTNNSWMCTDFTTQLCVGEKVTFIIHSRRSQLVLL